MEENWYALEQQIRDRLTEARAAARIRTLTAKLARRHVARTPPGPRFFVWRIGSWVARCGRPWSSHARSPRCERR